MSKLTLTPWQKRRLQRQLRSTPDAPVYRRTLAVLEVAQGKPMAQIARTWRVHRRSIYNWIAAYTQSFDPAALLDGERPGRPPLWTEPTRALLQELLRQPPDRFGYVATGWTVPLLCEHLGHCTGQRFSDDTIRRELDRLGYVWKHARYVYDPDPELEKKKGASAAR